MENICYIGGLNRDKLLEMLWDNAVKTRSNKQVGTFNLQLAKKQITNNYPDYILGIPIKADIYNNDNVEYSLYDRDTYDGAFLEVVNKLKHLKNTDFVEKASLLTNDKKLIEDAMKLYNELF